jgi:ribosomal protein S18 acetylase RimI-like enzyme
MKRRVAAEELRRATLRDARALLPLWRAAHGWHVQQHGDFFAPLSESEALVVLTRDLRAILADPTQRLIVATEGEAITGYVQARVRRTPPVPEIVATTRLELVQITVAPGRRRSGLGSTLLTAIRAWGEERGATAIVLTVWEGNRAALRFYARHGLVPLHRVLAAPIP